MSRAASLTCRVAVWPAILLSVLLSVADPAHAQQPDTTPPTVVNAATDETGQWITVTFSEPVVVSPFVSLVQEHRRFFEISYFLRAVLDVTVDGHRDVLEITTNLSGNTLNISLTTPPIAAGQSVRLSYDNVFARNGAIYVDTAGNALEFFSDMNVQNNSTVASAPSFTAGPVFSVEALTLDEGGSGTLTAKLTSPPPGEVTVYLYMWPPNVGSVTGPGSPPPTNTASEPDWLLTFDETTWNTPQTLTVTAGSDADSLDAWGLLHGFVGPPPTEYLRMNSSVHVLMEDQDPPLGIALATDPTVPLVEPYATRYFENDTTAIVDLTPIGHTTARWSLYLEDKNAFSISRDGVLSFRSPRDFEQPGDANEDNVYVVGILGQRGSSTGVVFAAITLANVAEPPTFPATATTRELPENPARFTDVGDVEPIRSVVNGAASVIPSQRAGGDRCSSRRSTTLRTRRGDGRRSAGLAGHRDPGHQRATRVAAPRRLPRARNRGAGARQPRAPSAQRRPGRRRLGRGALRQHPLPGSEPHSPRRAALGARGPGREQLDRPPDPGAGRHRESPPAPAARAPCPA